MDQSQSTQQTSSGMETPLGFSLKRRSSRGDRGSVHELGASTSSAGLHKPANDHDSNSGSSWPWIKWFEGLLIRLGILILCYFVLYTLQEREIWDPCNYKISYRRECKVDTYFYEVLSYTTYQEDYFCIFPGITFHLKESGWNMDRKCT